jgi:hypothetical protein
MRHRAIALSSLAILALAVGGFTRVAAQDATPAPMEDALFADTMGLPELQLTLTDAALEGVPAETQAGWHVVTFTNNVTPTGDPFEDWWSAEVIMLPEGMTLDEVAALAAAEPEGEEASPESMEGMDMASPEAGAEDPFAWLYETYIAGGPGAWPGQTVQGIVYLEAGDYAVWTFSDAPPVAMTVTGASMASPAAGEIAADATITEVGTSGTFDFQVDGTLNPGQGVIEVYNDSDQPHFIFALRSPDPITEDQVMLLLESEEGGTPPAGAPDVSRIAPGFATATQSTGTTQYLAVNLEPGYYVLLCFIGDPEQGGIPHAFEGMIEIVPVGV